MKKLIPNSKIMTKYSLSIIVSGILISIAFVHYADAVSAETLVSSQLDTSLSVITSESRKDTIVTDIDKPKASTVEKPVAFMSADFSFKSLKATVKGTSTLHDWESNISIMEGNGSFQLKDNVLASINDAEIKIAVKGIKSEEGRKMDNKTYETFESDKYPYIIYSFSNAVVKINDSQVVRIETIGNLSMAGASKSVSLSATGKELPNGDLQLAVSKTIKMTDYNMKPPVMFLGTIKVGDEITVSFDFILSKIKK